MKAKFIAKNYQDKGARFEVLGSTEKAILLRLAKNKMIAFQVIDFREDYPETEEDKQKANIFRSSSQKSAEKEYATRNQLKIS